MIQTRHQVDDIVECPSHVASDFPLAQIPAALFLDQMKNTLPRFRVGNVDHSAKDSAVCRRAEDGWAENPVEMLVRVGVVAKNELLCGATESFADVRVEAALPVAMAQRRCRRSDRELVRDEVIMRHRIGSEMCQVPKRKSA